MADRPDAPSRAPRPAPPGATPTTEPDVGAIDAAPAGFGATTSSPRARVATTIAAALVAIALLSVAACTTRAGNSATTAGGDPDALAAGTTPSPDDEGTPTLGGKLAIAIDAESDGYNPTANTFAINSYVVGSSIFDALAVIDENREVKPFLAESITPSGFATTWTIKLRPGVNFHDGTPCDAAAVAANIEAQRRGVPAITLRPIEAVVVKDALTVEVQMNQPWVAYPWVLASQEGFIASPKTLDDPDSGQHPVGTGPFVFESWTTDQLLVVRKNNYYWQPGKPYLDEIEFRVLTDPTARANTLTSGGVDMIMTNDSQTIADLAHAEGYRSVIDASGDVHAVMLNAGRPPFDRLSARRAIVLATDRHELIDVLGNGVGKEATQPFAEGSPYYDPAVPYPAFDPEAARQAVADYERESGSKLEFTITSLPDVVNVRTSQLLQGMWQDVGANVHINTIEQAAFIGQLITGQLQATPIANFGSADPDWNYLFWHSSFVAPTGQLSINFTHTVDAELDAALDAGRTDLLPERRVTAYRKVARRLNDTLAYAWLYRTAWALIARDEVRGLRSPERSGFARTDAKPWVGGLWLQR